jgi:O-antigen/teichoic acid export membrane protein
LVIKTFFGARYTEAAVVLRYFGLAMLPMALLLVLMNYFVAKGRSLFSYVMFLGAFLEIGMILLFHGSLLSVIWSLLGAGGVVLSFGFATLLLENRSEYSRIQRKAKTVISERQW